MSGPETPVTLTVDGQPVNVQAGTTILGACGVAGIEIPTLCWAANLTPAGACRLCVVEVDGSRALVASCDREAEEGMVVGTDSERVRHSRKMVLEFLGSGVDVSQAPDLQRWMQHYGADPGRYDQDDLPAARMSETPKVDDNLYVRDYDRCVLCHKCVRACGDDAQHSYAIAASGRGFDARISTEFDVATPDSACVYCGNCISVCPTGALQFKTEFDLRREGDWRPADQTITRTICSYCGVGCNLEVHAQDDRIVKVSSPADHSVTSGHLCIKGRFGWRYVQPPEPS